LLEFTLPETAEDVLESVVVMWYKSQGDVVQAGEPLVEVQTEKATFDLESPVTGVLHEILVQRAEVARVGDVLARIGIEADADGGTARENAVESTGSASAVGLGPQPGFVSMSPRLRRLAQQLGVDPTLVTGSGPSGRITEDDLHQAAATVHGRGTSAVKRPQVQEQAIALSPTRRTIAQRMMQSLQQSAQLTLTRWADVTTLAGERKHLFREGSWNDWVLKAVAMALRDHPELNSSWTDTGIIQHSGVHLGMAVDTEQGLIVPVLQHAESLTLAQIHAEAGRLSEQIRQRKLGPSELKGSTFTVTNLGSYGIEFFTPILNSPEAGILGVGQVEERLVLQDENVAVKHRLPLSLTFDHRVLDGAGGARFLQTLAKVLTEPESLV